TYYDQVTTDALFQVQQIPRLGFVGSQLENVGEIANRGLEVTLNADLYQSRDFGWSVGGSVATNRSEVLEMGRATNYNIQVGQPAPVIRGTLVKNADEFADPILEFDHFYGPNVPTLQIGLNTDIDLPYGIRLAARGEYHVV